MCELGVDGADKSDISLHSKQIPKVLSYENEIIACEKMNKL